MELRELKLLFDSGALREAHIVRLFDAWTLECTRPGRDSVTMTTSRTGDIRRFKSLDAAYEAARAVGFQRASVMANANNF
jgi:hypothetical protein